MQREAHLLKTDSISLHSESDKDNLSLTILEVQSISNCSSKLEFDSTKETDATLLDVKRLFSSVQDMAVGPDTMTCMW